MRIRFSHPTFSRKAGFQILPQSLASEPNQSRDPHSMGKIIRMWDGNSSCICEHPKKSPQLSRLIEEVLNRRGKRYWLLVIGYRGRELRTWLRHFNIQHSTFNNHQSEINPVSNQSSPSSLAPGLFKGPQSNPLSQQTKDTGAWIMDHGSWIVDRGSCPRPNGAKYDSPGHRPGSPNRK